MSWQHPYYPTPNVWQPSWSYAYVGQGSAPAPQPPQMIPPSDPSNGDPHFSSVYHTAVIANATEYSVQTLAAQALASHSNYAGVLTSIQNVKALWQKVAVDAQLALTMASQPPSVPNPVFPSYVQKFQAQASYHQGQLDILAKTVQTAAASPPGQGPGPLPPAAGPDSPGSAAPPEPLSAGMAAGWLVAIAAVGFIFFRVAILKRPL